MRRLRRQFKRPRVSWDETTISNEKKMLNDYGLKRKKELRMSEAILRNFRRRARELIAVGDKEKENILIEKLQKLGILTKESKELDNILALSVTNILERRLQTVIFRKNIGKTINHARQFIVHGKIYIDGRRIENPSYMVDTEEEKRIVVIG